jgi:uncharacterized protein (DUF1697 family)
MLKALNVGGKNVIPMKALAALFESCGARDVKTYVNSGNVVFDATAAALKTLPRKVVTALQEKYDIESCVVLRTREALQAALAATPFATKDTKLLMYGFFEGAPDKKGVVALDPDRSPPDRFEVQGRTLYLHCPAGLGRSKLTTAFFEKGAGTAVTMRNWNTVTALVALDA